MKKILLLLLMGFAIFSAKAQMLDASKVPDKVKTTLNDRYPRAKDVKWEMEDGKYEASFKLDGKSMSTLQDANGTITETETPIKISELPATVPSYIKDHYKGKEIKEASKIVKANGEINYEAELKGMDVVFDANGKFIKEQKD